MTWMHERAHASRNRRRAPAQTSAFTSATGAEPTSVGLRPEDADPFGIPRILGRRARWMTARLRPGGRT